MKKALLPFIFSLLSLPVFSQISNSGFENWTNSGVYVEPTDWTTTNSVYYFLDQFAAMFGSDIHHPSTVIKDATAKQGSFAVRIENVVGIENSQPADTVPGFAVYGQPFTQRPTALTGFYKFNQGAPGGSTEIDTALILVAVTKWNAANHEADTVGVGSLIIYTNQATFTAFAINITYNNGTTPDSLIIGLFSSTTEIVYPNTKLTIDALGLNGVTGINTPFAASPISVFPNPASSDINMNELPRGTASIEVSDITGRKVKTVDVNSSNAKFNITDLPSGIYFYNVLTSDGSFLGSGKFDVKK